MLTYENPTIQHDFPDPGVYYDKVSKVWYAYGTNGNGKNIQCSYSHDFCSWTHYEHDVLPGPFPEWTGQPGFFWAPEVISAPQGRPGHLMYVSCQFRETEAQSIGVAYTEGGPLGPYKFISYGPLIAPPNGAIDPQPFEDPESGKRFLVYKNDVDHMYTKGPQLWIHELGEDGLSLVGQRHPLASPHAGYQGNLLEAPYLTYHAPSRTYALFYSSGTFTTEGYATSYSISRKGIFGPYEPSGRPLLYTDKVRGIRGPGGACVVQGVEGNWFIVFHSLEREGGPRRCCVHRICWSDDGTPHLPGRPCEGYRLTLGREEEGDEQSGMRAKAGPEPTFAEKRGSGDGEKLKQGFKKFVKALT